jgi:Fe-S-cluster containining protein
VADDDSAPLATRADLERALRNQNLNHLDARDQLLQLAAHVVALTEELGLEEQVAARIPARLAEIRTQDSTGLQRVDLDPDTDKYEVTPTDVPCLERMHICKARCCRLRFSLSTLDLDEGIIRWDYGKPYQIRQRASDGYCTHNDAATGHCTVHANRPRICRTYDCKDDKRIWADFANMIPAPLEAIFTPRDPPEIDLVARLQARRFAHEMERETLDETFAEK